MVGIWPASHRRMRTSSPYKITHKSHSIRKFIDIKEESKLIIIALGIFFIFIPQHVALKFGDPRTTFQPYSSAPTLNPVTCWNSRLSNIPWGETRSSYYRSHGYYLFHSIGPRLLRDLKTPSTQLFDVSCFIISRKKEKERNSSTH